MIKIPFEDILARLREKTGLSDEDIEGKITQKLEQLSGLISREGAAHIVANELGVKLLESNGKVKDIYAGMRNVEASAKVQQVFPVTEFSRQDGSPGKVGSFIAGDETGTIRIVCWGEHADNVATLTEGAIVKVSGAMAKENNRGFKELHLNDRSILSLNPQGVDIGEVKKTERPAAVRKNIKDLQENDENIELLGTIVQVFDPRFFEICPSCNGRAKPQDAGGFACDKHGAVQPEYAFVLNVFLDDGTETIRCVLFRQQAERLLNKTVNDLLGMRDAPEQFEPTKNELLGQIVKFIGRAKKNTFFDKLEFNVQLVFPNPDPKEELARLQTQQQSA